MSKVAKVDSKNKGKRKVNKKRMNLWITRTLLVGLILSLIVSMFAPMFA